jgi:hypothetical protein
MKKIKKIRMIEFIDTLDKSDKIILDKEKDIIVVDYCIYNSDSSQNSSGQDEDQDEDTETDKCAACTSHSATNNVDTTDTTDTSENSDPEKDPYEPCKKKSRIDNDYISRPVGPAQLSKDKDDYYNIGIYTAASAVSAAATAVANNAAKYLIEDSEGNTTDSTDAADAADTKEGYEYDLENEIDESFRNIIQNIVYDKKKDD